MQAAASVPRPMLRSTSIGEIVAWSVAALLTGAAGIHFAMMGEHAGVSWTHGIFFAAVAWLQIVLAVGVVWRRSSRAIAAAVIVVNLAVARRVGADADRRHRDRR